MDVWQWVYEAQEVLYEKEEDYLADMLDYFSDMVIEHHHDQVDAHYPQIMARVDQLGSPWLKIFFRHWYLQSVVDHRMEITRGLPEAVTAMEYSHRGDNIQCPQSVCSVQDVCIAYGHSEGPGYLEERISVCKEAFEQIDPTWNCFDCISREYADALIDAERYEECIQFLNKQAIAMKTETNDAAADEYFLNALARCHIALGQIDKADAIAGKPFSLDHGRIQRLWKKMHHAYTGSCLGDLDGALRRFPKYKEVKDTPSFFRKWSLTAAKLIELGRNPSNVNQGGVIEAMWKKLEDNGAYHTALVVAMNDAKIGRHLKNRQWAGTALDAAKRVNNKMRNTEILQPKIEEMEKTFAEIKWK